MSVLNLRFITKGKAIKRDILNGTPYFFFFELVQNKPGTMFM